ncbi:MAG TPA: glycoside hydrolase family 88 protein [Polyangiaceae bacterium]|nr:glycoside hydrolase family 88 protein [Polyangiaceae bacterium]
MKMDGIVAAGRLADACLARHAPHTMGWSWGTGVLLYGLARFAEVAPAPARDRYLGAVARFHAGRTPPRIDRPDGCAPGLSALALHRRHARREGLPAVARIAGFVEGAPRNRLGCMDHLGTSPWRALIPSSIWVDTLAMATVFCAQWAGHTGNARLLDFAAAQPAIYAAHLLDRDADLFRHAYLVGLGRAIPRAPAFWLRGNGWALFAMVEILAELPAGHPGVDEVRQLLARIADAVAARQRREGAWGTLLDDGRSPAESSGTALVAYALARGARGGWLPASMGDVARRAMRYLIDRVVPWSKGPRLRGVSAATNPMPGWAYRLVPDPRDAPWGTGALLLAASEARDAAASG